MGALTPGAVATAIALLAFAAPLLAASVADDTGATVSLPAPARRIVALAPHAAELVDAAGAAARLIAVGARTDLPPEARALPVVGDANAIDVERILALAPDLVVTWPWTAPAQVARLRDRGIPVFTTAPRTIDGIASDIERLGALAGTTDTASKAATAFRLRLASLAAAARSSAPLRVFYQLSDAPLYTIGAGHTITQAIALCGGENVFGTLPVPAPVVNVEEVLAQQPALIVAGTEGARRPAWLDAWRRWPALPAARDAGLAVVDADLLHRPGPRFADGVAQLCAAIANAR
ncbi:MAG: cobalamin-binding protein [Betaproteobacteria bacterium]